MEDYALFFYSSILFIGIKVISNNLLLKQAQTKSNDVIKINETNIQASNIGRNSSHVWASGRPLVRVVITGVAAILPGAKIQGKGDIERIIDGENFISPVKTEVQQEMLQKNVVLLKKGKDGSSKKTSITLPSETINLCATIGDFDMTSYGVAESIANTMDSAVQVAVAAGLEALKNAGIVTGKGEGVSGWILPIHMQATTGVVYATSFPALDTAISEVTRFFKINNSVNNLELDLLISLLRTKLQKAVGNAPLTDASEDALVALEQEIDSLQNTNSPKNDETKSYEYDRKFLFRILVLGNAQLAQIVKAKGPNMQTNAACAGTIA